jgi:hypothetical protein
MSTSLANPVDKGDFTGSPNPEEGADRQVPSGSHQVSSSSHDVSKNKPIGASETESASSWARTMSASAHEQFDDSRFVETAAGGVGSQGGSIAQESRVLEFPSVAGMQRFEPKGDLRSIISAEADAWSRTPMRTHASYRFGSFWVFLIVSAIAASLAYIVTFGDAWPTLHLAMARMADLIGTQLKSAVRTEGRPVGREVAAPPSTTAELENQTRNSVTSDGTDTATPAVSAGQNVPRLPDAGENPTSKEVAAGASPPNGAQPIAPDVVAVPDVQVSSVPTAQPSDRESNVVGVKLTALQPASDRGRAPAGNKAGDADSAAASSANLGIGAQSIRQAEATVWTYCTVNLIPGGQIAVQKAMSYQACISAGKKCAGTRRYADIQYYDRPTLASKTPLELCYTES